MLSGIVITAWPMENESTEARKNDRKDGKLMWELLPLQDMEDVVRVYTAGAQKYGADQWQNLPNGYQRYKAAMLRHLVEFEKGNWTDEETGCIHLAQVVWNAIALLHIEKEKRGQYIGRGNTCIINTEGYDIHRD